MPIKKIDLHYTRHGLVRSNLIRFIEDNWNTDTQVEIITGNSPRMKEIVKKVLDEYKLEYSEGDFLGVNMGFIRTDI